jgi:membrane-anchored protein YejM (alkaline phosphatase superfamily)
LRTLEKKGLLKDTIILISADHGEEFYEHGHIGHTSAFTPEQNDVPLILYIPSKQHKIYNKLTCHYDIVPTLMPFLGVESPAEIYSNGLNMLGNISHKYVVASSWTNFAIIYNDYRFIFSLASYKAGLFDIRDNDFKIINNKSIFKSRIKDFAHVLKEISKF